MRLQQAWLRRHTTVSAAAMALALLCAGCSWFTRSDGLAGISAIPLTPTLRWSTSITSAAIPYQNACGRQTSISIAGPLTAAIPKQFGRVFTGVTTDAGAAHPDASQGAAELTLGLKQIDLAITRQVKRNYPVTVILGLELVFLADDGTVLFSKKIQSAGRGEVEVTEQSCDVKGLEPVVQEAVTLVTEGMARQVAESVRIREFAERRKTGMPAVAAVSSHPNEAASTGTIPPAGSLPETAARTAQEPTSRLSEPRSAIGEGTPQAAVLTFRAILRDENRDQILQREESLTIEIEVKNDGIVEAKGVEVVLGGTPALTGSLPPVLPIGDLQPGEVKRVATTKRVTAPKEPQRGELVLSLRSTTPILATPLAKKFTVLMKPEKIDASEPVPDVDQPPKPVAALKQPKALVIAIGVGRFREEQVPSVKYAGRDAEVVASYLRAIGSIPEDRVRVLIDQQALKQDLAETFDEWLPKRVDPSTVVYVFFSGRALVDGVTGAVSLVPFDGTTATVNRLYSVRRLQESLSRASVQRAILMFDVSLEPAPGADPAAAVAPIWDAGEERKDRIMWMVAHKGLQEAHAYEQGRHGLFTYHLLRGLQGLADADRDGTVVAGELCSYVRGQVSRVAREQFGNEQDPLCLPPPGQGAMVRIHPLAKGNNPKPAAMPKKEAPSEPASPSSKPSGVGPGQ